MTPSEAAESVVCQIREVMSRNKKQPGSVGLSAETLGALSTTLGTPSLAESWVNVYTDPETRALRFNYARIRDPSLKHGYIFVNGEGGATEGSKDLKAELIHPNDIVYEGDRFYRVTFEPAENTIILVVAADENPGRFLTLIASRDVDSPIPDDQVAITGQGHWFEENHS
ncbi:hypothetical protein RSAG8_07127, partial [Rhizoctonia solani AG-8 WAC10335]